MSPEQANNKPADHRSDIYALGCILYMMATGRAPFQGNQIAILYQHVTKTPKPPSDVNPDLVPEGVSGVILKCLEKDPAKRFPSARAVRDALVPLYAAGEARPWRRSVVLIASLLAIAIAGIAVAFAMLQRVARAGDRHLTLTAIDGLPVLGGRITAPHVTRARHVDVEFTQGVSGDVRARVAIDGAEPVPAKVVRIEQNSEPATMRIPLPDVPGAETTRFEVLLDAPEHPEAPAVRFPVLQDLQPPRVRFLAYGSAHAPSTAPIRVVRIRDLEAEIEDAGGFGPGGEVTRFKVGGNETPYNASFTRRLQDDPEKIHWAALVEVADRAGNAMPFTQIVEVAPLTVAQLQPADGAAIGDLEFTVAVTARLADPSSKIAGLDEKDVDLGAGAFSARAVLGSWRIPPVALGRSGSRYEATLVLPAHTPSEADFEIEVLFEGDVVASSHHRFDRVPPIITAQSGVGVVTSAQTYAERPTLYVDVRPEGRAAITCRIEDGAGGVAGARVGIQVGDAVAVDVPVDASGAFTLPPIESEESFVRITGRDAAGNEASTEFRVARTGLQVTSVRVDGVEPDDDGRIFVKHDKVALRIAAVGLSAMDSVFASILGDGDRLVDTVSLSRSVSDPVVFEAADLRLYPEGADWAIRRLRVLFGRTAATAKSFSRDVEIVYDREPPVISVTLDGGPDEMRGTRVVGRFPRLVVRVTDNLALTGAPPEDLVTWTRSDRSAPDVVIEPSAESLADSRHGPSEILLTIDRPPGPPRPNRFDFVVAARDRTGRDPVKRVFTIEVAPSDVAVLAVAERTDFSRFSVSAEHPMILSRENVTVSMRPPREGAPPCKLVVKVFGEDGTDVVRPFSLDGADGVQSVDFVVLLPKAAGGRLVEHGRMVLLLEEAGVARPDELATVYYLLDREPPTWEVDRNATLLGAPERDGWIKVASPRELRIAVTDGMGSGFADDAIDDPQSVVGMVEERSGDRIAFRLRDIEEFGSSAAAEVALSIRDVAGNVAPIRLRLARSKELLDIRSVLDADGKEPIRRDDLVIVRRAQIGVAIESESVGFQGVRWVVKRGEHEIRRDYVALEGGVKSAATARVEWIAPEGAEPYVVEFFAHGPAGVAAEPFHRLRVLVDAAPPEIYLRVADRAVAKGEAVTVQGFDALRIEIVEVGAGLPPDFAALSLTREDGAVVPAILAPSRDGTTLRIVPVAASLEGRFRLTVTARDRHGNEGEKSFTVVVAPASVPWTRINPTQPITTQPTTRASERDVANVAVRAKDEERTGMKFVPVWDSRERSGPSRFFMSQTEVTNEQFLRYADAVLKDQVPVELRWRSDTSAVRKRIEAMRHRFDDMRRSPALPVVEVEPEVAFGFAAWTGGRLPSRDEWIGAAGRFLVKDARYPVYLDHGTPRSDEFWMRDPSFANFQRGTREPRRVPVNELLRSQSNAPFEIVGFAGNVAEWVTAEPRGRRILGTMGGSYRYSYTNEIHGARLDREPAISVSDAGIRVVWPVGRAP
jgi:hypothetical protein